MASNANCGCCGGTKLIFPCSGGADVGAIADQAARKLTREGKGKMACTVGIGGRISGMILSAQTADKVLAIDGCPLKCAKTSLEVAGIQKFEHLCLADLGLVKGQSEVSTENLDKVVRAAEEKLAG